MSELFPNGRCTSEMRLTNTKLLFSFNGRINRRQYWMCQLVHVIYLLIILPLLSAMVVAAEHTTVLQAIFAILFCIAFLAYFYSSIAVTVKRLHDQNGSGWWMLLHLFPCIGGLILLLVCGTQVGDEGENKFGAPP